MSLVVAAVAVALVAVAAVAADRLLASAAARRVAARIGSASRAGVAPAVRFGGVVFATQLAAGRYRQVDVELAGFVAGGVEFAGLTARLTEVNAPLRRLRSGGAVTAGRVAATVTIPLAAVAGRLPPGFALRKQGAELAVVGSAVPGPVSGVLRLAADARKVTVTPAVFGIPSLVGFEIALPPLPAGLAVGSVTVVDAGLEISLGGSDVSMGGAVGKDGVEPVQSAPR